MTVTIAIKAFNEEQHIAGALESALRVAQRFEGQVVLADSASTDRTVAIAEGYPVRILQLATAAERSCGAGAQLAFQGVETPFFYLMDGDMRLDEHFIDQGLAFLETNPDYAGVGGGVVETVIANQEFRIRNEAMNRELHRRAGQVDRLDGGGLYRTDAVREIGYFSNANLTSFEEFDLAARLRAQGWKLARLPRTAVEHTGHTSDGFRLMLYRFRSGQMGGAGAVLRAAIGKPHFKFVVQGLNQLKVLAAVLAWWVALLAFACLVSPLATVSMLAAPMLFLAFRRRSLSLGVYSFLYWNLAAIAMLRAMILPQTPPERGVAFLEIKAPPSRPD